MVRVGDCPAVTVTAATAKQRVRSDRAVLLAGVNRYNAIFFNDLEVLERAGVWGYAGFRQEDRKAPVAFFARHPHTSLRLRRREKRLKSY